jgi:GPI ethanolamine phosphate transferase 1
VVTSNSVISLQEKRGLPVANQYGGWFLLGACEKRGVWHFFFTKSCSVSSSILPFVLPLKHRSANSKLLMYFLAFAPCFILLSISVEGLFYVAYVLTLWSWIRVESALKQCIEYQARTNVSLENVRIVLFFLFFVQVGFFGTGK